MSARDLVASVAAEREPRLYRRCLYCGSPCYGLACSAHRDLLVLDDNTYSMRLPQRPSAPRAAQEGAST